MEENLPQNSSNDDDEIGFEITGVKEAPPVVDPNTLKTRNQILQKIDREVTEEQVREDLGLTKEEMVPVPKEVPGLIFRFGAHIISCPKFRLDDDEAAIFAKHLQVLCEALHIKGWMWSLIVLGMIVLSKLFDCKDAIVRLFNRKSGETPT
jgi:hypothetical protein